MPEGKETVRLYDKDGYATEFRAQVISCEEVGKKGQKWYQVILDQTLFFPEEGGQSPDKGRLGDVEVCDVQIRNNVITHTLAAPLEVGSTVSGKIDWKHRFYNMQQHSGEHLFSGIVHERYGFHNVGFHLSDQIVTMDFDGVLAMEDVEAVEWRVNEAIAKNIEVQVSYPFREQLANMDYRSKIEIDGQVRIVTIPGYDVCACCAPHVHRTGEIGMLKVMNVQNYKGGVRISILCGFRALMAFREKAQVVADLSGILTTGQDKLAESVVKIKAANQTLSSQLAAAKQSILNAKVTQIPEEQADVLVFEEGLDMNVARNVINGLVEKHAGICGIFSGNDAAGYSYIIGSRNCDCKELAARLKQELNARGGGSPVMVQGSVTAAQDAIRSCLL